MQQDNRENLIRRIKYIERAVALNQADYLAQKGLYQKVFDKIRDLVESNQLNNYLEIDSTYQYLLEKVKSGEENLDQHALDIKDFIAS